jgi:stress-induced morphogen
VVVEQRIEEKLRSSFHPSVLQVKNESGSHSVPAGSETHFKVVVVAESFRGRSLVERHRLVYEALGDEIRRGVHALSIVSRTPDEWERDGQPVPASPPCLGGSKADRR